MNHINPPDLIVDLGFFAAYFINTYQLGTYNFLPYNS